MYCSLLSRMILGALLFAAPSEDNAGAVEPSEATKPDRGGWLVTTPHHHFEVFFYKSGLRIFPTSTWANPVPVSQLAGNVSFLLPDAKTPLVYELKGGAAVRGREPASIDLATDLTWVPVGKVKVDFTISGLSDPQEDRVTFSVPFVLVPPRRVAQSEPAVTPSAPRYIYRSGYYGVGYYPVMLPVIPNQVPVPLQARPVQREVPLERPWSNPHWTEEYNEDMDHNM